MDYYNVIGSEMNIYCPQCFNESLEISKKGIVHFSLNNKKMGRSRFLYNRERESEEDIKKAFEEVVKEYMRWFSTLQNAGPITSINLVSNSFVCCRGCTIGADHYFSVVDSLFSLEYVLSVIDKNAQKYNIDFNTQNFENLDTSR